MKRSLLVSLAASIAAAFASFACSNESGVSPSDASIVIRVAVSPASLVGGGTAQGTVTLSPAPPTGVTVLLSSNSDFAFVQSAITIPAGATTGRFTISTIPVLNTAVATIGAQVHGTAQSAPLTLTSGLTANFSVTSLSPAFSVTSPDPVAVPAPDRGAGSADTCPLVSNGGNPVLDCQFNGSTSVALGFPIVKYSWSYNFGGQTRTEESTGPIFKPTASGCGFFANQSGPDGPYIPMSVSLRVMNAGGGTSELKTNQNVRIYPAGLCGYRF